MPRIADYLPKSIAYLYESEQDAKEAKASGATGFIVGVAYERKFNNTQYAHTYLVTNEHVIHRGITTARLTLRNGESVFVKLDGDKWIKHPYGDDVAVCPISLEDIPNLDCIPIPTDWFVTDDFIKGYEIGIGDDVFIIGRFRYHEGRKRNLPTARFGFIAQMPHEKIIVRRAPDYDEKIEGFLAEMRSIGGYSGSPVFVYIPPYTYRMTTSKNFGADFVTKLLGIDFGHLPTRESIVDKDCNAINGWHVEANSAITVVVPAWKIQEILDMEELKEQRHKDEEHFAKKLHEDGFSGVVLDSIRDSEIDNDNPPLTREEFERVLRKATRPIKDDKGND